MKLLKIRGTIEATAHGTIAGPSEDVSSMRLKDQDGKDHILANVRILPDCLSYVPALIANNTPGIFLFSYHPEASTLFALKADGSFASDYEKMWLAPKMGKKILFWFTVMSAVATGIGIYEKSLGLTTFFSIVMMSFGLWYWFSLAVLRKPLPRSEVEPALAEMKAE